MTFGLCRVIIRRMEMLRLDSVSPSVRTFMGVFGSLFLTTFAMAYSIGFVPYFVDGTEPTLSASSTGTIERTASVREPLAYAVGSIETSVSLGNLPMLGEENAVPAAEPVRIKASSIGLDLPVLNPASASIAALDSALTKAAVRYPGSAQLGQKGNVLIFAHSSHLPIVHNQMYRAFNKLPDLKAGDIVSLSSGSLRYDYKVTTVRKTDANEEMIDLSTNGGARITLSTCDTFGKKSARWVVEAIFVGTSPLI